MSDKIIDKKDIENLASLSRMKLTESEKDRFVKEIGSILAYVHQIQEVTEGVVNNTDAEHNHGLSPKTSSQFSHRNIFREDVDDRNLNPETESLVRLAPESQDGYIKVKKILK